MKALKYFSFSAEELAKFKICGLALSGASKSKYRFKVKWNQSPSLKEPIKRGYYLVPNIREYGYNTNGNLITPADVQRSYAFTLDWDDYGDDTTTFGAQMIQDAIDCEDKFYELKLDLD